MTDNNSNLADLSVTGRSYKTMKPEMIESSKKENSYYMENYEATVTVHKSPPLNRKYCFEYLEIDDETKEDVDRSFPVSRLSKRKNLRVTFSDHIEVDVIEDMNIADDEDKDDADYGFVESRMYEIPLDKSKGLKEISSSFEFKTVSDKLSSPRITKTQTNGGNDISGKACAAGTNCQSNIQPTVPSLYKRKTNSKFTLGDLEKKTKDYLLQLQEKTKRAEAQARIAKTSFPDIVSKVKSQSNYKDFIANTKHALEITRRYARPWVIGTPNKHTGKQRSDIIRRSASLPKNFRLPDNISTP